MQESMIVLALIGANLLMTIQGFNQPYFLDKYLFQTGPILHRKEWIRLLSSGFLHADWMHFAFNMITFYSFGPLIEAVFGVYGLLVIYFGSLLGGNALALFIHRHNDYYRALGASGAVSGIVFASILVDPTMPLYLFFIPIGIPAWVIGITYMAYSINGMRSRNDNIGHEAHMGGALVGLGLGIALFPALLFSEPLLVGILVIPSVLFLFLLIRDPDFIHTGKINWHKIFGRKNW